jgi:hypothetical protein
MRRVAVTLVAVAGLALIPALSVSAAASGLRGLVVFSPTRPVCFEGQPCSKPAAHVVMVFSRRGGVAARVRTRADGTYRVSLQPGTYRVSAPAHRVGSGITPRTVRVPNGRTMRADFEIDTGIQ